MFVKFNKIKQFRTVLMDQRKYFPELKGAVFTGTVKIHGTNAGVCVNVGAKEVTFQSRNRTITPDSGNCGFASWAVQWENDWLALARHFPKSP